jgi:nucleoside-diphosphate-sugar epimerase
MKGFDVYRIGRTFNEPIRDKDVQLDLNNVTDLQRLFKEVHFDYIINASGYVQLLENMGLQEPKKLIESNYSTVISLLEAVKNSPCQDSKIIHLSTMSVYGIPSYLPVDEYHPTKPLSLYAFTKLGAEEAVRFYSESSSLPALILRIPGMFGGKRKSGALYHFVRNSILQSEIFIKTKGLKYWSTFYIHSLSEIIVDLINHYDWNDKCKIMNIGYNENINIIDAAKQIKNFLSSSSKINIEQPVDFTDFYMDNKVLRATINRPFNFYLDMTRYISELRELENI